MAGIVLAATTATAAAQEMAEATPEAPIGVSGWLTRLFLPLGPIEGQFEHGYWAWTQIPIILALTALTWWLLRRTVPSKAWRAFLLVCAFILITAGTNAWLIGHPRNMKEDFPIARALYLLDYQKKPEEADVIAAIGAPLARQMMTATDPRLPKVVATALQEAKMESALLLAWHEKAWGREVLTYVLLESDTKKVRSTISLNAPWPEPIQWPALKP
jgi:hypothetical protein